MPVKEEEEKFICFIWEVLDESTRVSCPDQWISEWWPLNRIQTEIPQLLRQKPNKTWSLFTNSIFPPTRLNQIFINSHYHVKSFSIFPATCRLNILRGNRVSLCLLCCFMSTVFFLSCQIGGKWELNYHNFLSFLRCVIKKVIEWLRERLCSESRKFSILILHFLWNFV